MNQHKISLMEAYMIETLRSHGISDDELLFQVVKKDVRPWADLSTQFDFNGIIKLYEQDEAAFKSIILDGYKVKFITFKGLQNLLSLKFSKVAEEDYEVTETGITGLQINRDQLNMLRQMLSDNWTIHETSTTGNGNHLSNDVKIELA